MNLRNLLRVEWALTLSEEELISPRGLSGPRVSIVGVGGAGNHLLNQAIDAGASPSNCVAVNTDRSQLSKSPADNNVLRDGRAGSDQSSGLPTIDYRRARQLTAHRGKPFIEGSDCTILLAVVVFADDTHQTGPGVQREVQTRPALLLQPAAHLPPS